MSQYRSSVSGIIKKGNKILIVHKPRKDDAWQLPQGGVDEGESKERALARELEEELGTNKFKVLCKSKIHYQYVFQDGPLLYMPENKTFIGQDVSFYLVRFLGTDSEIKLFEKELDDYMWVEDKDLEKYFLRKIYLKTVYEVLGEFRNNS